MKYLRRPFAGSRLATLAALATTSASLSLAACSGVVREMDDQQDDEGPEDDDEAGGAGGDRAGGQGGTMPKKLDRVPDVELACSSSDLGKLNVTKSSFSRLTNAQYVRTLRDLAAPIELDQDLARDLPSETADKSGFLNNYEQQTILAQHVEQYSLAALSAAKKLVANIGKLGISGCSDPVGAGSQATCAKSFIESFGRRAFRRPLDPEEKQRLEAHYEGALKTLGSFEDALTALATAMLSAPQLLYMIERGADDGKGLKLTGYEIATRVSYLVRGTTPDKALLDAAASGKLDSAKGIEAEVSRLLTNPNALGGLEDFASQWLRYAKLSATGAAISKDKGSFPNYSEEAAKASFAGLQRFVRQTLLSPGGTLRSFLTSDKAWVNSSSAPLYGVSAQGDELTEVKLNPKERRGYLTQAGVMAGFAHPTVQAPVQRGVFVLEHLLCSPPPPPPPNVAPAPAKEATDVETTREKFVREHENQPACKACHKRIDEVGFAFETYDALGRYQTEEKVGKGTLKIDSSGALTGTFDADGTFANALEMIDKLSESEQVAQCFVNHFFGYALARSREESDGCALASTADQLIEDGTRLETLVLGLVKSNQFRYRAAIQQ